MTNPIYAPSAPPVVSVTNSTNTSITLDWVKPNYDGGSDIIGYNVEYCEVQDNEEEEEWIQIILRTTDSEYTIPGLSEHKEYKLKVAAYNKQAVSEGKLVDEPYKPHVLYVEPTVEVDCSLKQNLKVKAGMTLRICGRLAGNPMPTVSWKKNNMPLPERAFTEYADGKCKLEIEKSTRNDSGAYTLSIANQAGSEDVTINVAIQDTPSAPLNLGIKEKTVDSATLEWEAPENDGGSVISFYQIEIKESTKKSWKTVCNNCSRRSYRVGGLVQGLIYFFRVRGVNEYGEGLPCDTTEGFRASETAGPVGRLAIKAVTDDSVTLEWSKAESDGGAKVTAYQVEYKMIIGNDTAWKTAEPVKEMTIKLTKLVTGKEYNIRVKAINENGLGFPREISEPVCVKEALELPDVDKQGVSSLAFFGEIETDIHAKCRIIGKPFPEVKWLKDGEPLRETSRLNS